MNIGSILAGGDTAASLSPKCYKAPSVSTSWMDIDAQSGEDLLKFNTFEHQRPVRKQKVEIYAQQMSSGDWTPGADGGIILARTGNGDWELMNGQHRILAVILTNICIPFQVSWYTFDSEADKYAFFASLDQGAKRSDADALMALGVRNVLTGVDKRLITTAASALKIIDLSFRSKGSNRTAATTNKHTNTTANVKRAIDAFADPIIAASHGLMGNRKMYQNTRNSYAFAIVLLSYTYAPEEAHEFWPEVIDPNVLTKGTPQYALHHYLLTNTPHSEGEDTYAFCVANAWNAYAEGRSLEVLKKGSNQTIMRLACTPFDGKNVNAGREIIAARLASHGGK